MPDDLNQVGGTSDAELLLHPVEESASPAPAPVSSGGGGRRGRKTAAESANGEPPARPSMMDVAREHAQALLGTKEIPKPTSKPPAATVGSGPQPSPAASRGVTPAAASAPAETANPFEQLEALSAALPAELQTRLQETIAPLQSWATQVQEWGQQMQSALSAEQHRLAAIAAHPTFRAALEHAMRQPGNGRGALPEISEDQFETPTERQLYQTSRALATELEQVRQEIQALRGGQEDYQRDLEQQRVAQFEGLVQQIHAELDTKYPELAKSPQTLKAWHEKAARLWDPSAGEASLRAALDEAARILDYEQAGRRGASSAISTARQAARSATYPETYGSQDQTEMLEGESLKAFGSRMAAAAGLTG